MRTTLLVAAASSYIGVILLGQGSFEPAATLPAALVALGALVFIGLRSIPPVRPISAIAASWVLGGLILTSVVVPILTSMGQRAVEGPATHVHDGTLQVELAAKFLSQGNNPYRESFSATSLADWGIGTPIYRNNPALDHLVYLPGHVVLSLIAALPFRALHQSYDDRVLLLLAYAAVIALAVRLSSKPEVRLRAVALLALNPLLVPYLVEGRNDVLVIAFLLGAFILLRRPYSSAALFGLALVVKTFAWIVLPLYVVVLWKRHGIRPVLLCLGVAAVIILPFVLWDPNAFVDDVVRYPLGMLSTSYPVSGFGFSAHLKAAGLIAENSRAPLWILQAALAAPLAVFVARRLWRHPTRAAALAASATLLLVVLHFSRFFFPNHLGVVIALAAAAWILSTDGEALHNA